MKKQNQNVQQQKHPHQMSLSFKLLVKERVPKLG